MVERKTQNATNIFLFNSILVLHLHITIIACTYLKLQYTFSFDINLMSYMICCHLTCFRYSICIVVM